jgi:hypothetical protein
MKCILNFKRHKQCQSLIIILTLSIGLLFFSCKEKTNSSKNEGSELIIKINAVQEQIMAQGNLTKEEEQAMLSICSIVSQNDGLATYTTDNSILLKDVEIPPVYNGCENLSNEETRGCFKDKVTAFIKREFDLNVLKELNLSKPKTVDTFFIITENGNLTGMKVRNAEVTIQAEILRVLRKMPVMNPAIDNGKSVSVLCSMIVKYGNDIEIDFVYIPERPND